MRLRFKSTPQIPNHQSVTDGGDVFQAAGGNATVGNAQECCPGTYIKTEI